MHDLVVIVVGYNVIDIIDKGIGVANKRKAIFEKIGREKSDTPLLKVMSSVLMKEVDKSIQYYASLKKGIANEEFEEIDFVIYDKIAFLINEFSEKLCIREINNVREYIRFSIDLEKDARSLLTVIQGNLVKSTSDIHTKTYKILSDVITNVDNHIKTLEKCLK
jgi:hypothetical protein